jgi:hypothetical protein
MGHIMALADAGVTMPFVMADPKKPERSPSWKVFARLDPALEAEVEAYRESFEYPPTLSKVIERGLRLLLTEHKKSRQRGARS